MTRDEAKKAIVLLQKHTDTCGDLTRTDEGKAAGQWAHEAFDQAISDMETIELLRQVLSELDQPTNNRGFELGKAWAYTQVSEWLENHELLRAEAKRLGIEEES